MRRVVAAAASVLGAAAALPAGAVAVEAARPAAVAAFDAPVQLAQDATAGRQVFARCLICHTAGQGEPTRVGPNLYGVFGRTAGTLEGFNYSQAMRDSGIVWTAETLDEYLTRPAAMVPGVRMIFPGLPHGDTDMLEVMHFSSTEKLLDSIGTVRDYANEHGAAIIRGVLSPTRIKNAVKIMEAEFDAGSDLRRVPPFTTATKNYHRLDIGSYGG